jgi:large conductance mechanosensitive channel
VGDVIMPVVGLLLGKVDFSTLEIAVGDAHIKYGIFLQSVVDFLIVAFCIFFIIRQLQRFKKKEEPIPVVLKMPTKEEELLTEIRDLLKQKN